MTTTTTLDDDIKALREALAAGPTPGPWYQGWHGTDVRQGDGPDDYGTVIHEWIEQEVPE